jgi:glycosyltransferase involved in cell wall biosynthesis
MPGYCEDVGGFFCAADVFTLTSREDPFPSVVLEAMQAGLPTVAFQDSGGIPDMLAQYGAGVAVPLGDAAAMADAILSQAKTEAGQREHLAGIARTHFAFDRYTSGLLRLARPRMTQVSAVVPNYNYARYLRERMASIFAQTHPVEEVIVLDDASSDNSLDVVRSVADEWQRAVRVIANDRNSGSVFHQWRRAAEEARGEFLWIAEADDAAEPEFLATLAERLVRVPDAVLAFTDSRAIDQDGAPIWPSYKAYYAQSGADTLASDAVFSTGEFLRRFLSERNLILNVSAVLLRRDALLAAFARCGDELSRFRMAGDWRLYVELLLGCAGSVVYVAQPLNVHRRHEGSVTHRLDAERHVHEIARVHECVAARADAGPSLASRQSRYVNQVGRQLRAPRTRTRLGRK